MKILTSCTLDCSDTCSLLVETGDNGTIKIEGNPDHPVTAGAVCAKTRDYGRVLRSSNRITNPLLRIGEDWQAIGWDEALDICASKINDCRREPSSILHIFDLGDKGVLSLSSLRFFGELSATRVSGSLCDAAGIAACEADFGILDSNDITGLVNARHIANWGKDLSRSSLHLAMLVKEARQHGAEVLTISPGGDGNGPFTDHWIRIRPGTDRFLAAAVIRSLIELEQIDSEILPHTGNWPAFRELVMAHNLENLSRVCEVSVPDIEKLVSFYLGASPVATLMGMGIQRYRYGGENVRFINALALLSGNIGRTGGGTYYNISSVRNFNLDWVFAAGEGKRRTFQMPAIGRDILAASEPPVRLIWVNGCNVINQAPDSRSIIRAFEQTEFKIVVDAFMNDTAERADLILPCALMFEREEVIGSFFHNYVHHAAPAVMPPEGVRSDHWILTELGKRLDPPVSIPGIEDCLNSALNSPYLDISLDELRQRGWVRANRPQVAFEGLHFAHPDGLYRFPDSLHEEPEPPAGFPLRLLTLVRKHALHSQMLPEDHHSRPVVWVSPECPALQELNRDGDVYLVSPLGRMPVQVETASGLYPGAVLYRRGDWMKLGGGANQLIAAGLTDMGEGAAFYSQYVRLENG